MNCKQWDQYAGNYHEFIISPFSEGVKNPLFEDIKSIPKSRVIADLGCGCGPLLPHLARFKKVYAVDFSKKMLENAKKCAPKNTVLLRGDLKSISRLKIRYDVAVAVNSILHPEIFTVDKVLVQIYASLNKRGKLFGIFPSMEAVLHHFQLVFRDSLKRLGDEKKALTRTRRIVELRKYDVITATYSDQGETQKFYYKFELRERLKKAGFHNIEFRKVIYPWGGASGDYHDFPGKPEMWDWYVTAGK